MLSKYQVLTGKKFAVKTPLCITAMKRQRQVLVRFILVYAYFRILSLCDFYPGILGVCKKRQILYR